MPNRFRTRVSILESLKCGAVVPAIGIVNQWIQMIVVDLSRISIFFLRETMAFRAVRTVFILRRVADFLEKIRIKLSLQCLQFLAVRLGRRCVCVLRGTATFTIFSCRPFHLTANPSSCCQRPEIIARFFLISSILYSLSLSLSHSLIARPVRRT